MERAFVHAPWIRDTAATRPARDACDQRPTSVCRATAGNLPRTFSLPLHMPDTAPSAPTILVAEDNADQRSLYVALLTGVGYRVLEAQDGAEAVEIVRRSHPGLVLMDVTMPGTSGWNAVRTL